MWKDELLGTVFHFTSQWLLAMETVCEYSEICLADILRKVCETTYRHMGLQICGLEDSFYLQLT